MRAQSENFKGIEFVRISSLPRDQQEKIWNSFEHEKIIKIIRDQALLNDCIMYQDYVFWLRNQPVPLPEKTAKEVPAMRILGKLAFE